MKKLVAILLTLLVAFSMFACKTAGTDGGGDGKEVSATDRIIAAHAKATGATKK